MQFVIKHPKYGYFMELESIIPGEAYWVSNLMLAHKFTNKETAKLLVYQNWPNATHFEVIEIDG